MVSMTCIKLRIERYQKNESCSILINNIFKLVDISPKQVDKSSIFRTVNIF